MPFDISKARCAGCGRQMAIERLRCDNCDLRLEGDFELSPLARLSAEDQAFVLAFLRHHGSIKRMESLFGISYPTVKNRLRAINAQLDQSFDAPLGAHDVLERLARGDISVDDALEELS